jgi:hypothetical protein
MIIIIYNNNNNNNNNNSIKSVRYYLYAGTTATRLITQTAQEYKKNTKIEAIKEITHQRYKKTSHLRITA